MLNIQFDHFEKLKFTGSQKVKLQIKQKEVVKIQIFKVYELCIFYNIWNAQKTRKKKI